MKDFVEARNNSFAVDDVLKKPSGGSGGCSRGVNCYPNPTIRERMIISCRKERLLFERISE
jgi:hypothetical protein